MPRPQNAGGRRAGRGPAAAARATTPDGLVTPDEVDSIIRQYSSPEAAAQVPEWKKLLLRPGPAFRKAVLDNLPPPYRRFMNAGGDLRKKLAAILGRALAPYGKEYDLVVLTHDGPQIMHESYSALTVTTGLLERIPSDDGLVMAAYHEMSHDLFAEESMKLKGRLEELNREGESGGEEARRVVRQLRIVELKCDAAATRFALAAGYDPRDFVKFIEDTRKEFPEETARALPAFGFDIHPAPPVRRRLVEAIAGALAPARRPRLSEDLKSIKSIIALERHAAPAPAAGSDN